ncbi:hypothetical protein [Ferrovum myxofaciens]|uniref:hypothetical protein n=1 Tax=Ferrovum myxofaciens TaxID=416213 RepID=UPI0023546435|nr:hypothetical protein [Ferrovum myxofaciens]MBU6994783.1 hypothetical protein [Ferrovum myxofaciens]
MSNLTQEQIDYYLSMIKPTRAQLMDIPDHILIWFDSELKAPLYCPPGEYLQWLCWHLDLSHELSLSRTGAFFNDTIICKLFAFLVIKKTAHLLTIEQLLKGLQSPTQITGHRPWRVTEWLNELETDTIFNQEYIEQTKSYAEKHQENDPAWGMGEEE